MRRNKLLSVLVLMGFLCMLVFAQPTFAWDVSIFWKGHPSVNPASPAQGYLDGVSDPPSGGNRWHYAEDSYTWWTPEAKSWILANQAGGRYKESLVFHTFKPNTNDACGLGVETNPVWVWTNLPGYQVFMKSTAPIWCNPRPINEIRIRIGNPSALGTGSGSTYYAQMAFKDWSPYENGEVTNDSYWEDTWWFNSGVYKDYLAKFLGVTQFFLMVYT